MDGHEDVDAIERAWRDGLKPDPLLTVSEWADRYRILSQRATGSGDGSPLRSRRALGALGRG
jgi:phage terminase large subunit GpA-like protein